MQQVVYDQSDSEMLDVGAATVGFTATKLVAVKFATCYVDSGEAMVDCANTPTSTVGRRVLQGDDFTVSGGDDLAGFKAIRIGTVNAKIFVQYHKYGQTWSY
jgi:hypothetical protein